MHNQLSMTCVTESYSNTQYMVQVVHFQIFNALLFVIYRHHPNILTLACHGDSGLTHRPGSHLQLPPLSSLFDPLLLIPLLYSQAGHSILSVKKILLKLTICYSKAGNFVTRTMTCKKLPHETLHRYPTCIRK